MVLIEHLLVIHSGEYARPVITRNAEHANAQAVLVDDGVLLRLAQFGARWQIGDVS